MEDGAAFGRLASSPSKETTSMSERFCTWIEIGGQVDRSQVGPLIKAITEMGVATDWGEPTFEPEVAQQLLDVRVDGRLRLCDEQARYGEFPELEKACRRLGLGYRRHCEGWCGYDAEILDWRPGMDEPLARTGSNANCETAFVDVNEVKTALTVLEAGRVSQAIDLLRQLCRDITPLPPFEII